MSEQPSIFFGAGAGRCGSMMLANLLNAEDGVLTLHEGKIREIEESKQQWLPFLTLENYQAYAKPETAEQVFADRRKEIPRIIEDEGLRGIGDIAYNNSPFVGAIPKVFPTARLIVLVRDGRDFVRSVYTSERPDPTPVGWLDDGVELNDLEKFIAFGRLRPVPGSELGAAWPDMTPVEKNAWLWAETYRIVLDAVEEAWSPDRVKIVRAEDMFADPTGVYGEIREFLRFDWPVNESVQDLLTRRINSRSKSSSYILPKHPDWTSDVTEAFWAQAGPMMDRLGYHR